MTIVAAVDQNDRLSTVLSEARSLGNAFEEPVHTVHVMPESEFNEYQRGTASERGGPIDEEAREIAAQVVEDTAADVPNEFVGLLGQPSEEILRYVRESDTRYVVLGPRKRSPAGKSFFGSVAQKVLLNASVPMVTVIASD